jgi:formate hydrogenlyase subunit 6/NADH:ubiquinone oxidoreductase subunit I
VYVKTVRDENQLIAIVIDHELKMKISLEYPREDVTLNPKTAFRALDHLMSSSGM